MPVSITEIKNRLPKEFMENLYEMFTPGMVDNILKGIIEIYNFKGKYIKI